jgi:acetate CoA/acetoacetate CoA-transferase beta subunit
MAVIEPTKDGLVLREKAPGTSIEDIIAATEASLLVPQHVPDMPIE